VGHSTLESRFANISPAEFSVGTRYVDPAGHSAGGSQAV
jgi:hypothetical protein